MIRPQEIGYSDELLADGSVHRRYEDGREEWRHRERSHRHLVRWHDNRNASGTDELLGDRIIKRTLADGTVTYARDIGYGRTLWGRGETVMVNRTSFGGRTGAMLAGLGVAGLAITAAQLPPLSMSPQEEEALRQQQAQSQSSSGDSGGDAGGGGSGDLGDGGSHDWDAGWNDGEDAWSDDDFG
ncbi:hypothetical protein OHA98_17510 [Streptomyces sp. NBC_00654]|uniref:hypothetical protein n=1 Tax=Streptomyces sp. NBC_00654 TaxID=2975799 RepID=UPI00225B0028|nr:hypothetical protein [Streptomyces sp. NBC_00654]MCX4966605.1 hypothetical protein [Streptomyces sp. NBC_00654]